MEPTITLSLTGYHIQGTADITLWGGGKACIEMTPFKVPTLEGVDLRAHINDNGFGVERINGAVCNVFENYEGHLVFKETLLVGRVSNFTLEKHNEGL